MFPGTYLHEGNLSSALQAGEVPMLRGQKQPPLCPALCLPVSGSACVLLGGGHLQAVNMEIWPTALILGMDIFSWHVHILDTLSRISHWLW